MKKVGRIYCLFNLIKIDRESRGLAKGKLFYLNKNQEFMWDDEDNDDWEESGKNRHNAYGHPLLVKSKDIAELTMAIVGSMDEARKELYGNLMIEDARVLQTKFVGAEACEDYIQKMENAVVMKIHARQLHSMTYQLSMESTHAEEHLQLLRQAIADFKKLFVNWIKTFNPNEKSSDGWGIFEE